MLAFLVCFPIIGQAEEPPVRQIQADRSVQRGGSKEPLLIRPGMSKRDIRKQFGDPDDMTVATKSNLETWDYGNSFVIFSTGIVSAWSDNGDLSVRKLVPRRSRRAFERDDEFARDGWKRVWRREQVPSDSTAEAVLDDLVGSSDAE